MAAKMELKKHSTVSCRIRSPECRLSTLHLRYDTVNKLTLATGSLRLRSHPGVNAFTTTTSSQRSTSHPSLKLLFHVARSTLHPVRTAVRMFGFRSQMVQLLLFCCGFQL